MGRARLPKAHEKGRDAGHRGLQVRQADIANAVRILRHLGRDLLVAGHLLRRLGVVLPPHREVLEVRFGSDRNKEVAPILSGMCDRIEELPDRILLYVEDGEALLEAITAKKLHPNTSLVRRSSLEDVFLRLTGRSLIE